MKATVVGGGIVGLSIAYHLALNGYSVVLYEMEYPGYGASGKSAGIIVTIFEEDLLRHVVETYNFYKRLPESKGRVVKKEALWIVREKRCIEKLLTLHERVGLERPRSGIKDLGLEIRLGEDYYTVIRTFIVDTGWVINTLHSLLMQKSVEVRNERVERREKGFYAGGERLVEPIIIAAGPWTPRLVPEISRVVATYRCQIASVEGPTPKMVIEDDSLDYYLVPVSPARFNIGDGSNSVIDDPFEGFKPDPEDTYMVLEKYAERVPSAWESRIIQIWSAPCIATGDGVPLIAEVEESVYVITGFNGAGMSLAPSMARLLVDHIRGLAEIPKRYSSLDRRAKGVVEPYTISC